MAFFIRKPIGLSGMFGGYPAGYDDDPAPLSYPFNKLIAVISLIRKDQSTRQIERLQQCLSHTDIIAVSTRE